MEIIRAAAISYDVVIALLNPLRLFPRLGSESKLLFQMFGRVHRAST
jgi:hypothetical protein